MFCHSCGGWRRADHKFCPKCGISLSSSSSIQVSTFKNFLSQKSKERQTAFKSTKKPKMDEFVTITIGIGSTLSGVFKPVRGKSLPLKVKKHASAQTVLDEALKKRSSYDRTFRNDKTYKLCFPDGSEVTTLPGSKEAFTLEKYKEDLGKTYARINLFLCPLLEDGSDSEPEQTCTSEFESLSDEWLNDMDLHVADDDTDIFPAFDISQHSPATASATTACTATSESFTRSTSTGVQCNSSGIFSYVLNFSMSMSCFDFIL